MFQRFKKPTLVKLCDIFLHTVLGILPWGGGRGGGRPWAKTTYEDLALFIQTCKYVYAKDLYVACNPKHAKNES